MTSPVSPSSTSCFSLDHYSIGTKIASAGIVGLVAGAILYGLVGAFFGMIIGFALPGPKYFTDRFVPLLDTAKGVRVLYRIEGHLNSLLVYGTALGATLTVATVFKYLSTMGYARTAAHADSTLNAFCYWVPLTLFGASLAFSLFPSYKLIEPIFNGTKKR
jgi:hypothetical protein